MENSPSNSAPKPEIGPKPPESDKDKKDSKKSKAIGSIAFEHPETKSTEAKPAFKLFEREAPADKPELALEKVEAEAEKDNDSPEMTDADTLYAAQRIAQERQAEIANQPAEHDAESQAATEAAQEFYDKIVEDDQLPEAAASEVLDEIEEPEPTPKAGNEAAEEDDEDAVAAPTSTPPLAGGSGGSSPPPAPPHGPAGSPPPPSNPNSPSNPPIGASPNFAPTPAPGHTEYVYDRSRSGSDFLVGGIVGYLIGRRRGRIKTERNLLPVQKKLEREIVSLKQSIVEKEFTIREAAKRRVREQQNPPAETVIMSHRERPISAPEIHKPRTSAPPERIGKVLLDEVISSRLTETQAAFKPEAVTDKRSVEHQVETLSRNELLTLSEKVIVEGSTLRQVYETHLISERGLRRLITEYLRGGDVVKAFRQELVEREIDFERDPKLRDTIRKGLSSSGGASPTLHKLLRQAGVSSNEESQQELAQVRAQHLYEAKQQTKQASRRRAIDVSLITIIAVLVAVVVVLAVGRM